jgi:hypothetical protein
MARNAAESINISITNQRQDHPDSSPMGCSRSFRVNLTSSTTNEISLIYGIDTDDKDGLLAYLPNGDQISHKDQVCLGTFTKKSTSRHEHKDRNRDITLQRYQFNISLIS